MSVSVIIATYNRPLECKRAIDSVLAQTYPALEILVVDDGSVPPFEDSRVQVIRNSTNTKAMFGWASPGYIRTLGMKQAKGDFIAFLDDDDMWLPTKLETQMAAMRTLGVNACCSDALCGRSPYDSYATYPRMIQDQYLAEINWIMTQKGCFALQSGIPNRFTYAMLHAHNLVITSSMIVRRSLLESVGFMKTVPLGQEDWKCWLDISKHTDVAFVSSPCLFYDTTPSTNR